MARIGLIDNDYLEFPNFALMKISAYHKAKGDSVEWANPFNGKYDIVYRSKIFTFSKDNDIPYETDIEYRGGTGYDIKKMLPDEIENSTLMDYSIYPNCNYSIQFFSRGCIRHCPFCLVHDKEGYIHSVKPVELNPKGKWIEVLDNNFFANPDWKDACEYLIEYDKPVKFHGVDVRIITEEQCEYLNRLKIKGYINIAWDLPKLDLKPQLEKLSRMINPNKISVYMIIGFNSTKEEDLYRANTIHSFGFKTFAQAYRNFDSVHTRKPTQYEKDFMRWANRPALFKATSFEDFEPRKGFKCKKYYEEER